MKQVIKQVKLIVVTMNMLLLFTAKLIKMPLLLFWAMAIMATLDNSRTVDAQGRIMSASTNAHKYSSLNVWIVA